MQRSEPFKIRSNDRVTAVGKTGSGKTTAVKKLVWKPLERCVFYDIKGQEYESLNAPVLETLEEVQEAMYPDDPQEEIKKFVFRPRRPGFEQFDELCRLVYERRNHHLIADELKTVYQGRSALSEHHNLIMTNGRSYGVGMTNCTQRPKRVPLEALSEAEHIFTFKLKIKDDRDRMEGIYGEAAGNARDLSRYRYIYDHDDLDEPKMCEPLEI